MTFLRSRTAAAAVPLVFLSSLSSLAQARADAEAPRATIQVRGDASLMSAPDRAAIDLGVVTHAVEAAAAARANAAQVAAVIAVLRDVLGPAAKLETVGYALTPEYRPPRDDEAGDERPRIIGYLASNTVRVTLDDLDAIGLAIDAATAAGANDVRRIRYLLRDDAEARAAAVRAAALDARAKAEGVAHALELEVGEIVSIVETSSASTPVFEAAFARVEAPTPILPAELETRGSVMLELVVHPAGK